MIRPSGCPPVCCAPWNCILRLGPVFGIKEHPAAHSLPNDKRRAPGNGLRTIYATGRSQLNFDVFRLSSYLRVCQGTELLAGKGGGARPQIGMSVIGLSHQSLRCPRFPLTASATSVDSVS
jgi:hypothetical protein